MPKLTNRVPSYRLHRPSGQAVVTLDGRDHYLGPHGSPESHAEYRRLIAQWLNAKRASPMPANLLVPSAADMTINELFVLYWGFAQTYYVKNGRQTGELANLRDAAKPLMALYGPMRVREFGPLTLEVVRQAMVSAGLCRTVINARVNRIRRMFRWGVAKQIVPAELLLGLQAVAALKEGRSNARESSGVRPVAAAVVDATIPHTNRQVAAMIQIQRYTGMRPGEVTIMRGCDLDRTGKVWFYRPASHKTEHHGRSRVITLGPKAQQAVKPFLKPDEQAYLFSPKDVHAERSAQRRMARQTPMTPSQAKRRPKAHPRKAPGDRYTTGSYEHVIYQACDKAFPVPKELNEEQAMQWRKDHRWAPNQLRHTAATFLRKRYGLEAARVILGHSTPAVTEIYAELDQARAVRIMGKVG